MSEDKKRKSKTDKAKRRFGRSWSALVFVAAATIVGGLAWKAGLWISRSADAQLAAIDAARAIPESEDAGVAYRKLTKNHLPIPYAPRVVDRRALTLTVKKPWLRKDYPKLAAWLDEHQDLISKLLDISRMEECRLTISDRREMSYSSNPIGYMCGWTYMLVRSANNDVAEGRIDAAIEKYACVLQMGVYLCQQPILHYYNKGVANESLALDVMKELISEAELTERQLTVIEAALPSAENNWKKHSGTRAKVQGLLGRRGRPKLTDWRRYWEYRKRMSKMDDNSLERTRNLHLHALANRRSAHILIALRRFKNKTGHWPQSLHRIEPLLSTETLTDPRDNAPFVYELTGEDFRLGSRGAN